MPEPYPREFGADVVRVARSREDGVTVEQVARDFGVDPMTLARWLRQDRVDAGEQDGIRNLLFDFGAREQEESAVACE